MATIRILVCSELPSTFKNPDPTVELVTFKLTTRQLLYKKIREYKPNVYVTIDGTDCKHLNSLNHSQRRRWVHYKTADEIDVQRLVFVHMYASLNPDIKNPLISVVSTSFKSAHRIFRPYNSLVKQTYNNWEWIIYDDSDDNNTTWNTLVSLMENDYRIKLIRSANNDGSIGSVKNKANGCANGEWLVELDHDDHILPSLLEDIVGAAKQYPDAGFIYSDFAEVCEEDDGNYQYGELFGLGYGAYSASKWEKRWVYKCETPHINFRTLRHIVGVPNHVRCWRKDIYHSIGGYNIHMSVADDYELILRTFLVTKFVRLPSLYYIQWRNTGGNNFTFKRNQLIQKLVAEISLWYEKKITDRLNQLYAYKVDMTDLNSVCLWKNPQRDMIPRLEYTYRKEMETAVDVIYIVDDYDLKTLILNMNKQTYGNWNLYIINSGQKLDRLMDELASICDDRVHWWTCADAAHMLNYALMMCCHSPKITYVKHVNIEPNFIEKMVTGLGQGEYFVDGPDIIHVKTDKYRYWKEGEDNLRFLGRWNK